VDSFVSICLVVSKSEVVMLIALSMLAVVLV
jgi:hypothetical protein